MYAILTFLFKTHLANHPLRYRSLLFLFYFNRVFALVVSYAIRAYTWHTFRIHISFEALQISLLAGRIFFKGVRYHGHNETILVTDGYITWRYWLRRVKEVDVRKGRPDIDELNRADNTSSGGAEHLGVSQSKLNGDDGNRAIPHDLPCRILLEIRGVEWFIYNRSPAYDSIFAEVTKDVEGTFSYDDAVKDRSAKNSRRRRVNTSGSTGSEKDISVSLHDGPGERYDEKYHEKDVESSLPHTPVASSITAAENSGIAHVSQDEQSSLFLKSLPIGVECNRGAIVMGNENTTCVLVAKFDQAKGEIGAQSCQPMDLYRQTFDFDLTHPVVQMKPNQYYKETQMEAAQELRHVKKNGTKDQRRKFGIFDYHRMKHKTLHSIRGMIPRLRKSVESLLPEFGDRKGPESRAGNTGQTRWLGLSRYLDDHDDDGLIEQERWKAIEYAEFQTILDSPNIAVSFFWDAPGLVINASQDHARAITGFEKDINGTKPPGWGVDIQVSGGTINYGPWADRQRTDLQSYFFPTLYSNATPARPLRPGETRVATVFTVHVEIEQETTLRVLTREESKDWKWKDKKMTTDEFPTQNQTKKHSTKFKKSEKSTIKPETRTAGWLDITVSRNTYITYTLDMVASTSGFGNKLRLDLRSPEMSTSVNHGVLWRSQSQIISCDLSSPLEWNFKRDWRFDICSNDLELFILRDHMFLLTDLINDWTAGPPGDFHTFVPFLYSIHLQLPNFRLYLNANDSNIINNPSDTHDNTFLVVWGDQLTADICISLQEFRPLTNRISFDVDACHGGFELLTPVWKTQTTFLDTPKVATLEDLRLDGSYDYCASTSPSLTDTLFLNLHGVSPVVHLYGFLVGYFMKFKDNYFGEDLHFQTLEEYQSQLNETANATNTQADQAPVKLSNDLDVILSVAAENACVMLPANLYSAKENIKIDITSIAVDLRFTNYYMDLEATFSPFSASSAVPGNSQSFSETKESGTQVFVEGATIYGHRLFGLPPTEPTYVCNWDFDLGKITGECSIDFVRVLTSAIRYFAFSFGDAENALPPHGSLVIHDLTLLRAKLAPIRIWIHVEQAALLFSTDMIKINFNDWAGAHFSNHLQLVIPQLTIASVDGRTASRHRSGRQPNVITHAYLQTTVDVRMVTVKPHFVRDRQSQQDHISLHDTRTQRTPWLVDETRDRFPIGPIERKVKSRLPAMPFPPMPEPLKSPVDTTIHLVPSSSKSSKRSVLKKPSLLQNSFLSDSSLRRTDRFPEVTFGPSGVSADHPTLNEYEVDNLLFIPRARSSVAQSSSPPQASRQSSFQSLPGLSPRSRVGLPPSSVAFSSSYDMPYFPLHKTKPDTRNVPEIVLPQALNENQSINIMTELECLNPKDDSAAHTSISVNLCNGLRAFCTPEALENVNKFMDGMQTREPVSLLDDLQLDAMSTVISKTETFSTPTTKQIRFQLPIASLRFISQTSLEGVRDSPKERQFYDLISSGLVLTSQLNKEADGKSSADIGHDSLIHVTISHLGISSRLHQQGQSRDQANVNVNLYDASLWLAASPGLTGELQFANLEISSSNRQVHSLVSLLKYTQLWSEKLVQDFRATVSYAELLRRRFVLSLATYKETVPDPAFLASASYVLRSAVHHPRLSDSWKLISRLRYVHQIATSSGNWISSGSVETSPDSPDIARLRVVASFDRWRSWDLVNIEESALIKKVYGVANRHEAAEQKLLLDQVKLNFKAALIRLVIEPGPQQNEITIERLMLGVESGIVDLRRIEGSAKSSGLFYRSSTLEIFCTSLKVHLNWDITKLTEDIIQQFQVMPITERKTAEDTSTEISTQGRHNAHIVAVLESGLLRFDSINFRSTSVGQNLRTSLILSDGDPNGYFLNCITSVKAITTDFSAHSRLLLQSLLLDLSLFVAVRFDSMSTVGDSSRKISASCRESSFEIREDLLGLLSVVDSVIGGEIRHVYKMAQSLQGEGVQDSQVTGNTDMEDMYDLQIILSLGVYDIDVMLLPSLKYIIKGAVARSSLMPSAGRKGEMVVDFDLKEHTQGFVSEAKGQTQDLCVVPMPSANGLLIVHNKNGKRSIAAYTAIESIVLDASLVRGLMSTSMKSELSTLISRISRDIEVVMSRFQAIVKPSRPLQPSPSSPSSRPILYRAHVIVAGLSITATATSTADRSANLHLDLGSIDMKISNKDNDTQKALKFDEATLRLREVKVHLERSVTFAKYPCGEIVFALTFRSTSKSNDAGELVRSYEAYSSDLEINIYTETASMIVDVIGHLQQKLKTLDLSEEIRSLRSKRRLRAKSRVASQYQLNSQEQQDVNSKGLFNSMYSLEMNDIQISWNVGDLLPISPGHASEDLVMSITKIDLATKKSNAARLEIQDFQLQMVPTSQSKRIRSFNSALLPEVVFNVAYLSTETDRRFAFQVAGKSLDLRLTSSFILPASDLQRSMAIASQQLRKVTETWNDSLLKGTGEAKSVLGNKNLSSLLVDADFAGAVVYIQGKRVSDPHAVALNLLRGGRLPQHGRYGQFTKEDASSSTTLRAPGVAWKVEYKDLGVEDPSLNAEIRVSASTNILHPTVVPLILEISSSIKEVVGETEGAQQPTDAKSSPHKFIDDEKLRGADPSAILGTCKLNLGLRICRQEFSLSCQPIARVAAIAQFEDIYITVNTVQAPDQTRFFAVFAAFTNLQASVQHVYSRESTGSFEVKSIVMSLMNSKHVSTVKGLSAILKISPMKVQVNAKQLQDFLLFREIWIPQEMRHSPSAPATNPPADTQTFVVQRYQQVAAAGAFPWNATVSVTELNVNVDLGQALGKSTFSITNFWISQKKTSDWEQNLCLGFDRVGIDSTGRMSGFVELQNFGVRTRIRWPEREGAHNYTPLIQASMGFDHLRVKAAFDFQAFLVADVSSVDFLMYNVREVGGDRLVAIVNADKIQAFCTATSAAQALALYQAILRLIQEKRSAYESSLKDIEKYLRRKSTINPLELRAVSREPFKPLDSITKTPIQLHNNVVVTIKEINAGAFPNTFFDNQIFKLEALDASARFTVALDKGRVHSGLGLTIGQLRIALSGVSKPSVPKSLGEMSIGEVVNAAIGSHGGTILKVPRVVATMQTWQSPASNEIDYIFKSSFEGKVEVGWNYSRISFIRGLWATHSRTLAHRLGKPLPQSALQITGGPQPSSSGAAGGYNEQGKDREQEKITAVVHVPQSKYQYVALEPPLIETPQLRDMGEATPPLEWIGLHRERLPNVTHQIVIVTLLEVAKEVEDAYERILGSS